MVAPLDGVGGGGAGYLGVWLPEQGGEGKKSRAKHSSPLLCPLSLPFPVCNVETPDFPAAKVKRRSQVITGFRCWPGM